MALSCDTDSHWSEPARWPIRDLPLEASFRQQQARFNHYLPAEEHPGGFAARALPGGGGYELDLSDEPSGLSLYLPFGIDTGGSQVLGFGVGMLPAGVRLEARVRHYGADSSSEEYTEPVRWRNVRAGEQVELRFGLPAGAAGKLVAELRFSAEGGAGKFGSGRRVEIRDPWIEKTEWSTESRLVTLCDEKDKYRYGFNGQEKDNEIRGLANSLDFGERGYDNRVGRFPNPDPLEGKFPGQSTYSFAGDNPIFNIDKNGETKTTFLVIKDETSGKSFFKVMSVEPGLKSQSYKLDDGFGVYETGYNWFDYNVVNTVSIDKDRNVTFNSKTILGIQRTTTSFNSEWWASVKTDDNKVKDKSSQEGWMLYSKYGHGDDNEFNPKAAAGSKMVDAGSILNIFSGWTGGFRPFTKGLNAIKAGLLEENKAGNPLGMPIEMAKKLFEGTNERKDSCKTCGKTGTTEEIKKDGYHPEESIVPIQN